MRVTNKQAAEIITRNLHKNHQILLEAQNRVSTQKKINKPSDDPTGMGKILDYRKILSSIEQHNRNIVHGKTQIEMTETVLEEVDSLLKDAKKWAMQFGSGDTEIRNEAITEVKNIYDAILYLGNTKIGNNFIFSGHVTDTKPFSRNADGIDGTADDYTVGYSGDDGDTKIFAGNNVEVKINATGRDIFDVGGTGGGTDVFGALENLINALEANDPSAAFAEVANITSAVDQVQVVAAETAIYYGRLEAAENHLIRYKSNIENMLSEIENVDMAQAIVELQLQETAYVTSLEVASRIIQPSLVDFVK